LKKKDLENATSLKSAQDGGFAAESKVDSAAKPPVLKLVRIRLGSGFSRAGASFFDYGGFRFMIRIAGLFPSVFSRLCRLPALFNWLAGRTAAAASPASSPSASVESSV
jgi:hypothetical protein